MTFNPVPKPKTYCRCGCGTEISPNRKYVSGHNLKRRPKDAIVREGRTYKVIKCSECGVRFERRTDQINRYGLNNFCSKKCMGLSQSMSRKDKKIEKLRKGEYKKCKECQKTFYAKRSELKRGRAKYCSRKCRFKMQKRKGIVASGFITSANNSGKNNGMYKHGKRIGGHISKKKIRSEVIYRDGGNWCLLCGKPAPGLHLHRIIYGSQGGKYEVNNCVQLCASCHGEVHSSKSKWMPVLKDHIKNGTLKYKGEPIWK